MTRSRGARVHGLCRTSTGFTLTELLVCLALISLMSLAAFNYLPQVIHSNRMTAEVNRFVVALALARSEAVKQGRRFVLCPQTNRDACTHRADWANGWLLFASEDRERDAGEPLLLSEPPLPGFLSLRSGNQRKRVVYQPDGSSGGTNASFTFCDREGLARPRVICLSNSGRPRTTFTRCDGGPIACP